MLLLYIIVGIHDKLTSPLIQWHHPDAPILEVSLLPVARISELLDLQQLLVTKTVEDT